LAKIYVRGLWPALALSVVSSAVNAQEASGFGGNFFLSIRDCTGVEAEDSCNWPGDPPFRNGPRLSDFRTGITGSTDGEISEAGYGSAQGGVEFGGELFTPTLRNAVSSTDVSRNGASIFAWQQVTYTGTAPVVVPFGGEFTYSKTGPVDDSCRRSKEVTFNGNTFTDNYNVAGCGSLNVALFITDLATDEVIVSRFVESAQGEVASPTLLQADVEMIPGRAYEIYAQVQTIARGAGQSIMSLNSFEVGLVDPDTGEVTKDVPDSLPQLQDALVPASEEDQPAGIEIDVLPGSADNPINVGSRGVLPVALITTADFFAPDVDRASLRFGPGSAAVALPGGGPEDVDGDGDLDYVVHFRVAEAGVSCDDERVYLSGSTMSGDIVIGADSVQPISCR
jgi:hypothetical protein